MRLRIFFRLASGKALAFAAAAASVSASTVRDFEKGRCSPIANNFSAIRTALEAAGVILVEKNGEGAGARPMKSSP